LVLLPSVNILNERKFTALGEVNSQKGISLSSFFLKAHFIPNVLCQNPSLSLCEWHAANAAAAAFLLERKAQRAKKCEEDYWRLNEGSVDDRLRERERAWASERRTEWKQKEPPN
jgi:hypothetical protein